MGDEAFKDVQVKYVNAQKQYKACRQTVQMHERERTSMQLTLAEMEKVTGEATIYKAMGVQHVVAFVVAWHHGDNVLFVSQVACASEIYALWHTKRENSHECLGGDTVVCRFLLSSKEEVTTTMSADVKKTDETLAGLQVHLLHCKGPRPDATLPRIMLCATICEHPRGVTRHNKSTSRRSCKRAIEVCKR
jgi:hypothetical protein